ncbi:MAG: hypothetical protein II520_00240, partial [Bacilli bacterium]|nr:hypothetical protein [Bacilli bacterium]
MINKKIGVLLLAASALLVACGGGKTPGKSEPTPSSESTPAPELPVEEGKTTVWFQFKAREDGVTALESYVSPFITGNFAGWKTGMDNEDVNLRPVEMTLLEGTTDIYYCQIDNSRLHIAATETVEEHWDLSYQLTLGWNASSNAPAAQQGINWSYKADYNALQPGDKHPVMDAPVDGKIFLYGGTELEEVPAEEQLAWDNGWDHRVVESAKLPYQTFAAQPAPVKQIENYEIAVEIADVDSKGVSKPSWVEEIYVTGAFKGWSSAFDADHLVTKGADGYYHVNLGTVYNQVTTEI